MDAPFILRYTVTSNGDSTTRRDVALERVLSRAFRHDLDVVRADADECGVLRVALDA